MFLFRLFQFRSPHRDQETDKRRIELVQKAARSAVADAEAEVKGLRTRIAKARTSVTSLLAQIQDGGPEPARRAQLTNVEQRLLAGERRLTQMKEHLALLREIEGAAALLTSATITETGRSDVVAHEAPFKLPQMTNIRALKIVGGPHDGQTREVECDSDNIVLTHRTVVWKWDFTDPTLAADEDHTYVLHRLRTGPMPGDEFAFFAHSDLSFREAIERQFAK